MDVREVTVVIPAEGDPVATYERTRAPRACSFCRQTGHNWATCEKRIAEDAARPRVIFEPGENYGERVLASHEGRVVSAVDWRYLHERLEWAGYRLVDEALR